MDMPEGAFRDRVISVQPGTTLSQEIEERTAWTGVADR